MIPSTFQYKKAASVKEALALMAEHGDDCKLLAGGHSLIPAMKLRLNAPEYLIDVSKIAELKGISEDNGDIVIGAMATHHDISRSELIQKKLPILAQAAELIGDIQVRNRGTLGGSIAHADPSADWPALLLATEAEIVVQRKDNKYATRAKEFFKGFFETSLEEGEIVTQIRFPIPAAGTKSAYVKFMQPASRFAIVGCAVMLNTNSGNCENVRVAFTGVADSAFRDKNVEKALNGKAANAENIKAAASQAAQGVNFMTDHFASEEYRQHLAKVYAKRALMEAIG